MTYYRVVDPGGEVLTLDEITDGPSAIRMADEIDEDHSRETTVEV